MAATVINLPNYTRGNTFAGYKFNGYTPELVKYNLTGATIQMSFRRGSIGGTIEQTLEIGSGLEWVNQSEGEFKISADVYLWTADKYYYEAEITLSDSTIQRPIRGTWTIKEQITS